MREYGTIDIGFGKSAANRPDLRRDETLGEPGDYNAVRRRLLAAAGSVLVVRFAFVGSIVNSMLFLTFSSARRRIPARGRLLIASPNGKSLA